MGYTEPQDVYLSLGISHSGLRSPGSGPSMYLNGPSSVGIPASPHSANVSHGTSVDTRPQSAPTQGNGNIGGPLDRLPTNGETFHSYHLYPPTYRSFQQHLSSTLSGEVLLAQQDAASGDLWSFHSPCEGNAVFDGIARRTVPDSIESDRAHVRIDGKHNHSV